MEYHGKLYGKLGYNYFPLQETSEDFDRIKSALEDAVIGLEWKRDNQPELFDKADDEKLLEWKKILKQ